MNSARVRAVLLGVREKSDPEVTRPESVDVTQLTAGTVGHRVVSKNERFYCSATTELQLPSPPLQRKIPSSTLTPPTSAAPEIVALKTTPRRP